MAVARVQGARVWSGRRCSLAAVLRTCGVHCGASAAGVLPCEHGNERPGASTCWWPTVEGARQAGDMTGAGGHRRERRKSRASGSVVGKGMEEQGAGERARAVSGTWRAVASTDGLLA
jgi:hypothetical protein